MSTRSEANWNILQITTNCTKGFDKSLVKPENASKVRPLNPTWHKIFFGRLDKGGGWNSPPPGKHNSGTFMSSNDLVTHQAHKNGQF